MKGSDFCKSIGELQRFPARERAIVDAALAGSMLPLVFADVPVKAKGLTAIFRVATDVLAIGDPDDFVRMPLSPLAAELLAERLGFSLITKRLSDATWLAAKTSGGVVLEPQPMTASEGFPYDASMMSVARLVLHNTWIERSRAGRTGLLVGHKKDVVLSNRLLKQPTQVAIYGWQHVSGLAIQPLSLVHESTYADYSHGIRFMEPTVIVEGMQMSLPELAAGHPDLLLDEDATGKIGPLTVFRQPGSFPESFEARPAGDTEPAPGLTVSEGALAEALIDLDKGIHEIPLGSNSGPVIDDYLRAAGVGPHNEWCAAAVTAWLKRGAERVGKSLAIAGSAGALNLGLQLAQAAKGGAVAWIPKADVTLAHLAPGAVIVWQRPEAGPGKGHVGLVHSVGAEHFWTVEGNVGDWVAMREHRLDEPHLVGVGVLL